MGAKEGDRMSTEKEVGPGKVGSGSTKEQKRGFSLEVDTRKNLMLV